MYKRYIITGAPGTGKTNVIDTLQQYGYSCYGEISREIIRTQQKVNSDKTPWMDWLILLFIFAAFI